MTPTLNEELLFKAIDHATSASNWDQEVWYKQELCGTFMCLAGFVAIDFLGAVPTGVQSEELGGYLVSYQGETVSVDVLAREALGLTYTEASSLFDMGNNAEDLRRKANKIIEYRRGLDSEST